ncbi:MAG: FkbM family methyltransferase [Sulfuritalea sp.]|jgi:FkbM family methyltransferase|nr:FkbM family methyltransferase [Sulfuritalea sp.]
MTKYKNVLTQTDFGPMIININDDTIGMCISKYGYWGGGDIQLIQGILTTLYAKAERMCLLDIGTNIGTHTLAFAKYPFRNVTVHGFEAQRQIYYMLAGTIALNNLTNVFCHNVAVSNIGGVELRIPGVDYNSRSNFGSYELERAKYSDTADMYVQDTYESVRTVRIDDMQLDDVKLMKIDVEGMEDKVIDGARSTIERNRPVLFVETFKTDFPPIQDYLGTQHYAIFLTPSKDAICIPAEHGMGITGAERIC